MLASKFWGHCGTTTATPQPVQRNHNHCYDMTEPGLLLSFVKSLVHLTCRCAPCFTTSHEKDESMRVFLDRQRKALDCIQLVMSLNLPWPKSSAVSFNDPSMLKSFNRKA